MPDKKAPLVPEHARWVLPIFYAAATLLLVSVALALACGAMWLLSQYFIHSYGNMQYPARAHIYNSVELSFLAATLGLGHYYIALFFKRILDNQQHIMIAWMVSGALVGCIAFYSAIHTVFNPPILAALPVIIAFIVGGRAGWRTPDENNPFKNTF